MPTLTLREGLDRPLTYEEMDDNLRFVETRAQEADSNAESAALAAQFAEADRQAAQTAAGSAEDAAQSAAGSASTSQYWAEQAQDIVADGVVDDSGPSSVTTYSSELIETKLEGKAPSSHNHNHSDIEGLGTAATRDVTTSDADNTPGRLLKVGDLGSGIRSAVVVDFNELPDTYPYSGAIPVMSNTGSVNGPPKNEYYYVEQHLYTGSSGNVTQIAIPYRVDSDGYFARSRFSNVWSPWREFLHTGNIGSQRLDLMTASYAAATSNAGINTSTSAVVRVDANANRTLSLTNPPANNRAQVLTVLLTGNTGTITWPSAIRWSGGAAPDLMASWTAVTLMWAGDGYWYGFVSGGAD